MSYRIKTVAALSGISRNTITAWERRYGLLTPDKDASGYRSYTDAHVALLRRVKAMLDAGYQIGDVRSRLAAEEASQAIGSAGTAPADPGVADALLERLLAFDREGADRLAASLDTVAFNRRIDDVYMPMLRDVGDRWADGTASVAQEHAVSTFVREQLITMLRSLDQGPADGPRVICAGFPGDQHELGLLATAVRLAMRGQRVLHLGADLPSDELVVAAATHAAEVVYQSVTTPVPADALWAHVTDLRCRFDPGTLYVIGGPVVESIADRRLDGVIVARTFSDLVRSWDEVVTRRLRMAGK